MSTSMSMSMSISSPGAGAAAPEELEEEALVIFELMNRYAGNAYILAKLKHIVCRQLPVLLDTLNCLNEKRAIRQADMQADQEEFIGRFLAKNQYHYCATTDLFFQFHEKNYFSIVSEDEIMHKVLTNITSKCPSLIPWKQKTKISLMKRIRYDHNIITKSTFILLNELLRVVRVLYKKYSSSVFSSIDDFIYFLVIVGDNLLKKESHLIHFIPYSAKSLIRDWNQFSQSYFGSQINATFKHKFYAHDYENCRLVPFLASSSSSTSISTSSAISTSTSSSPTREILLNELCISIYLSRFYVSSDMYVMHHHANENNTIFYLKTRQPNDIISHFINTYLVKTSSNKDKIDWRNMFYLWKHYLRSRGIPSVMFRSTFRDQISTVLLKDQYCASDECFQGIFSKHYPMVEKFMAFWDASFTCSSSSPSSSEQQQQDLGAGGMVYKIDEIRSMFLHFLSASPMTVPVLAAPVDREQPTSSTLTAKQIVDILHYYYPHIDLDFEKEEVRATQKVQ